MKPKAPNEHEDGMLEYMEDIIGELEGVSVFNFVVYYWIISLRDLFLARSFSCLIFFLSDIFLVRSFSCSIFFIARSFSYTQSFSIHKAHLQIRGQNLL